jgi:ATP synthase in type III secretion protein N
MSNDSQRMRDTLVGARSVAVLGRLRSIVGLAIEADVPGARLGELCEIERDGREPLLCEVVGFREHIARLLPLGRAEGLGPDDVVRPLERELTVTVGDALLGRVLDGLGRPIDGGEALRGEQRSAYAKPPAALSRTRISEPLATGVRAIDGLLTLGVGQRVGLVAGSGVGKSTLLAQIARQAEADVFVACLVGERGRELADFVDVIAAQKARGVIICATADEPPLVRMKSALVATAIAEHFRDRGQRVVLLVDSITRFARAAREVGLAAGEPPVRRGYPASVLAALPELLERAGTSERGAITALYTVLVEGDETTEDPIADELRGTLDGHIVLSRTLAARGHYPAIDVPLSLSRLMTSVTSAGHRAAADAIRAHIARYEEKRDLIALGAYVAGSDKRLDRAIDRIERIHAFLQQEPRVSAALAETIAALEGLA